MSKRGKLQAEWLEIWRKAGSPQLGADTWDTPDASLKVRVISSFRDDNLGPKHYINIRLGAHDVTRLFSMLAGYKGRGSALYSEYDREIGRDVDTIMRRNRDDNESASLKCVISQAIDLHAAAAKAFLDVAAYRATGLSADELEARLLARATKRSRRQPPPKAL